MTSNELTIELKQHTPMIHFQHKQSGATLRGTELKPKLDKFLKKYAFDNKIEDYKTYLIGYDKEKQENEIKKEKEDKEIKKGKQDEYLKKIENNAFDYRVKINLKNKEDINPKNIEDLKYYDNLYLGNIGSEESKKNRIIPKLIDNMEVELKIFSFHTELITKIEENIESFFAITNFGARQNKGFGSFYPTDGLKKYEGFKKSINSIKNNVFFINYPEMDENNQKIKNKEIKKQQFEDIYMLYKLMKSGYNFPDFRKEGKNKSYQKSKRKGENKSYQKSLLFKYFLNKGIDNEKKFIKCEFSINRDLKVDNPKYVRAVLGVAPSMDFPKICHTVTFKSDDISRFKSPITFKIVDNNLAIIPEEIPKELFNKKFKFSNDYKSEDIYTPEDFDLEDFLKYVMRELTNKNGPTYKEIKDSPNNLFSKPMKNCLKRLNPGVNNDRN
ncbi:hypothetical protein J3E07_001685 [Methanococcus voltae]|uniref:Uncharacterized protein n=1 Tax=Methanococcus voltae TaxID=2188 RepID=A0A8J7RGZ0_METVO|nr:hypothetical protein [Methanococcus voltae]MBP2202244.1 hypothetical protein [Methanococcus voltae]